LSLNKKGKLRADYGEELLKKLSADMTVRFGKGFSRSNLQNMRLFYLAYPKCQTLSGKSSGVQKFQSAPGKSETVSGKFEPMLSWSHYCELLKIEEPLARSFNEQEAVQNNWSVRELKRIK